MVSEEFSRTEDKGDHTSNAMPHLDRKEDRPLPAKSDVIVKKADDIPHELRLSDIPDGDIIFHGNSEIAVLKICRNGDFIVNDRKVINDMEVYHAMRKFLQLGKVGKS